MLRCEGRGQATLRDSAGIIREWRDPLEALAQMPQILTDIRDPLARWIGYISYDFAWQFENLPTRATDDLNLPPFIFTLHATPPPLSPSPGTPGEGRGEGDFELRSTFSRSTYIKSVQDCIDFIAAGDVFQVNLSQRFTAPLSAPPQQIFSRLIEQNSSRFGAFLEYEDFALISNSPELFLRITPDRKIMTRPIKGTRPRLPGMDSELRDSPKDQAELNMIVDVERNDLGRICEIGSVKVTQPREIEAHPTVYHGVSTVEGKLRDDVNFVDILRATFPTGSVTGAPKIRAMEIIDQLEPVRRGPYCGAIGYLDSAGNIEFNVAIRTMIITNDQVHIPVGGGIVADSDPQAEYEETLVKAQAMFAALGIGP